jgi:hypothetical protein
MPERADGLLDVVASDWLSSWFRGPAMDSRSLGARRAAVV